MIDIKENQILFVGSHTHTIDDKKRVILPSTWRNLLGTKNSIYIFPHSDRPCLHIYSHEEMNRRLAILRNSTLDQEKENVIRGITSSADMILLDSQGRIRIKDNLLHHIEIKNQIVFVGVLSRIEIWSLEKYESLLPGISNNSDDLFFSGY